MTMMWNFLNIIYLTKKKRYLSLIPNVVLHFILASASFIIGCITTVVTSQALQDIGQNIYGKPAQGNHWILAANGSYVWVTPENIALCPAFQNCQAQQSWILKARARSAVALVGCALVDVSLYVLRRLDLRLINLDSFLHVALFVWTSIDLFYGMRPKWPPSTPQRNVRDLRISDPVLISAPWTNKLISQDSLELLHKKNGPSDSNTLKSQSSMTSLSDVESEINSSTYRYPGRPPEGNAFAVQKQKICSQPPIPSTMLSRLSESERPPLQQPLFENSRAAHVLLYERKHRGAPPSVRRPRNTKKSDERLAVHPDLSKQRAKVYTPRGSLNDRGLLHQAR